MFVINDGIRLKKQLTGAAAKGRARCSQSSPWPGRDERTGMHLTKVVFTVRSSLRHDLTHPSVHPPSHSLTHFRIQSRLPSRFGL